MKRLLLTIAFAALALTWRPLPLLAADWSDEETASGVKKEEYLRYAFAGHKMELAFLYSLDIDCSLYEGYAYEIIKQPEHGTAELKPHTAFPYFPKGNPRTKCNEQKVDGQMLTYKPEAGYKGPDSLTFLSISPGGFVFERTFRLNVRQHPATTKKPKQKDA